MKTLFFASIFAAFLTSQCVAIGTLFITTDKTHYLPGEEINISITATGMGMLYFTSSCQSAYLMDKDFPLDNTYYDSGKGICLTVLTQVQLPHTWQKTHEWDRYAPGVGTHSLTPYVFPCAPLYNPIVFGTTFTIIDPFDVTYPDRGERFLAGSDITIQWYDSNTLQQYNLLYSTDAGQTWIPITSTPVQGNSHGWTTPPEINSDLCLIKVELSGTSLFDISDNTFTIFQCQGPVDGDMNGDCYVDLYEYSILAANWWLGICDQSNNWCQGADTDINGQVDLLDLAEFLVHWLNCGNPFDPACIIYQ